MVDSESLIGSVPPKNESMAIRQPGLSGTAKVA